MSDSIASVLKQVLQLKASERAAIAEQILLSLDVPNPEIDAVWAQEADARIEAYERGEIESIPAEDVFAKYKFE